MTREPVIPMVITSLLGVKYRYFNKMTGLAVVGFYCSVTLSLQEALEEVKDRQWLRRMVICLPFPMPTADSRETEYPSAAIPLVMLFQGMGLKLRRKNGYKDGRDRKIRGAALFCQRTKKQIPLAPFLCADNQEYE